MAEKEERIAIAKMIVNTDDEGSAELGHFKIYSRQETLKKIGFAIQERLRTAQDCNELAEAALDALLKK